MTSRLQYVQYKILYNDLKTKIDYMEHPINHYYACSSHNTYLLGSQVFGKSSAQQYSDVIETGCRHVELDIYDNLKIKHGPALTGHVELESTLTLIKKYVDNNPDGPPIILNLENNCKSDCDAIRDLCYKVLGDNLSIGCMCNISKKSDTDVQKHEMINYIDKIIIRDHPKHMMHDGMTFAGITKLDESTKNKMNMLTNIKPTDIYYCPCNTVSINYDDLSKALNFKSLLTDKTKVDVLQRCMTFAMKTKYLTVRTYPPGTEIMSGNYDTILCMSLGVNYTAINFQTNDHYKQIYMSFFAQSNGYVLKPDYLCNQIEKYVARKYTIELFSITFTETVECHVNTGFYTYYHEKSAALHSNVMDKMQFMCYEPELSVLYFSTDTLFACLPLRNVERTGYYSVVFYRKSCKSNSLHKNSPKQPERGKHSSLLENTLEGKIIHQSISISFMKYFNELNVEGKTMIIYITVDSPRSLELMSVY